jgi:hypothetical protein
LFGDASEIKGKGHTMMAYLGDGVPAATLASQDEATRRSLIDTWPETEGR